MDCFLSYLCFDFGSHRNETEKSLNSSTYVKNEVKETTPNESDSDVDDDMSTHFGFLNEGESILTRTSSELDRMILNEMKKKEDELGTLHPTTLAAVITLANHMMTKEKYALAEALYKRALEKYTLSLGPYHFGTLTTIEYLGDCYVKQNKLNDAETLYENLLKDYEKNLGEFNMTTLKAMVELGDLKIHLKRFDDAEKLFKKAIEGYECSLGTNHLTTRQVMQKLSYLKSKRCSLSRSNSTNDPSERPLVRTNSHRLTRSDSQRSRS